MIKKSGIKISGIIIAAVLLLLFSPAAVMGAKRATPSDAGKVRVRKELSRDAEKTKAGRQSPSDAGKIRIKRVSPSDAENESSENDERLQKNASGGTDDLTGRWTVDGTTVYQFDENGHGALILPGNRYPFSYTAEEGELLLKFTGGGIGNVSFDFAVTDNVLVLERKEKTGTAEFIMEKQICG